MRKLFVTLLLITVLSPTQANAFFNSDCKNLGKRTSTNQVKYEKAWNAYQSSLANWLNAGSKYDAFTPVLSRLRQVGSIQVTILEDFRKFPKCTRGTNSNYYVNLKNETQLAMNRANWLDIQFKPIFSNFVDWRKELK